MYPFENLFEFSDLSPEIIYLHTYPPLIKIRIIKDKTPHRSNDRCGVSAVVRFGCRKHYRIPKYAERFVDLKLT